MRTALVAFALLLAPPLAAGFSPGGGEADLAGGCDPAGGAWPFAACATNAAWTTAAWALHTGWTAAGYASHMAWCLAAQALTGQGC